MNRSRQSGGMLALVMLGLAGAGVLATIAYGSYYQIARGSLDTVTRAQSSAMLTQASYTLSTESADTDSDGISEAPAGVVSLDDGWEIPATSGAPPSDAWSSKIKYCPFDNGGVNASAGRLTGANPALQSSIEFALISAGPNRSFSTSCVQAASGVAMADDGVRTMNLAQINQGVGGTVYFGDPVVNVSALPAAGSQAGSLRMAKDTQIPYVWNGTAWLPLNAGAWLVIVGGSTCTAYPAGTLARDAADDLYLCTTATRVWKRVQ